MLMNLTAVQYQEIGNMFYEESLECPYHWSDGMYSEHGCYIEEGRLGTIWQKLSEMLRRDEYSGCFIPSFVLKALYIIQDMKNRRRYEKYLKEKEVKEE